MVRSWLALDKKLQWIRLTVRLDSGAPMRTRKLVNKCFRHVPHTEIPAPVCARLIQFLEQLEDGGKVFAARGRGV
jgi:hypothetical protein